MGVTLDAHMKAFIKARKIANDFLTTVPVSELMDEIRAAITQDCPQGGRPPVPDPAGTDQGDVGDEEPPDSRYVRNNLVTADQMQRDVDGKVQQYCDHCAIRCRINSIHTKRMRQSKDE